MEKLNLSEEGMRSEALHEKLQIVDMEDRDAPEGMKEEVFSTLDKVILLTGIAELFTTKFTQAGIVFFDTACNSIENDKKE